MNTAHSPLEGAIGETLSQISALYCEYFDRTWFTASLRELSLESRHFQDIRHALTLVSPTVWDLPILHRGVAALEVYVGVVRQKVVPRTSQLFGSVHTTRPGDGGIDDARLHQRLVAYTLPYNVDRLATLIGELKKLLPPIPANVVSGRPVRSTGTYGGVLPLSKY